MAELTSASINNLPDSAFAYIEPGGTKDASGKTVPRSLRHFPVHDKAHAQNALARMSQSPFGAKAKGKIMAAAAKFGIDTSMRILYSAQTGRNAREKLFEDQVPRASSVDATYTGPSDLAGQYEPSNIEELQQYISELASESGIHQNSNQGRMRDIIDKLKAAAARLNAESLIPPAWYSSGTVLVPRGPGGDCEERVFTISCELRSADNGNSLLAGYASTFNDPYQVRDQWGEFEETILPGAWARTLAERGSKIHLLVGHGAIPIPLASTRAGTLRLWEDGHGLGYEAELAPTRSALHQDVVYAVESGAMDEMSVGMRVPTDGDRWTDGNTQRTISEAALLEISVLPRGANTNTHAMMREEQILAEIRKLELALVARRGIAIDSAQRRLAAAYQPTAAQSARQQLLDQLK